jgi:stage II sporulation protein D
VAVTADAIELTTLGYGHRVGLSQYGADAMARQGRGYVEILQHYYTGVTVAQM